MVEFTDVNQFLEHHGGDYYDYAHVVYSDIQKNIEKQYAILPLELRGVGRVISEVVKGNFVIDTASYRPGSKGYYISVLFQHQSDCDLVRLLYG